MNGLDFIADTNAIIYIMAGKSYTQPYTDKCLGVSVITEMELLSFPCAIPQELANITNVLNNTTIIPLTDSIKKQAILIRRLYSAKLPDAIVAATAMICGIPLLTADKGFKKINELNLQLLEPVIS